MHEKNLNVKNPAWKFWSTHSTICFLKISEYTPCNIIIFTHLPQSGIALNYCRHFINIREEEDDDLRTKEKGRC